MRDRSFRAIGRLAAIGALGVLLLNAAPAAATIEAGHPELNVNGVKAGAKPGADQVGWGTLELKSEGVKLEIECVNLAFGDGWNEGGESRAYGRVMGWSAGGDMPHGTRTLLSSRCRPESNRGFATGESWLKAEQNGSHEVETARRSLSLPWNAEARCGVREEEFVPIVKIGIPTSEFPGAGTHCPETANLEAEEAEIITEDAEREKKLGCYRTNPAPEGCIRVTVVEPGSGAEIAFGGSLWPQVLDGVKNGLSPTRLKLVGRNSGELQCEYPEGCGSAGLLSGEAIVSGSRVELITLK